MLLADTAVLDCAAGGRGARRRRRRRTWPRFERPHPRGSPAARGDHRLLGQRRGRAHYPRWLAAGIHVVTPNKRANSADAGASTARCSEARRAGGVALSVRGDGRRRAADHADAARPARDGRRDPPDRRASSPARCRICSTCGTAREPFSRGGARRQGEGLHRARSARRPVRHGRGPQAGDPGARDGPAARARDVRSRGSSRRRSPACTADEFLERAAELDAPMLRAARGGARAAAACCATWRRSTRTAGNAPPSAWWSSTGRTRSPTST